MMITHTVHLGSTAVQSYVESGRVMIDLNGLNTKPLNIDTDQARDLVAILLAVIADAERP